MAKNSPDPPADLDQLVADIRACRICRDAPRAGSGRKSTKGGAGAKRAARLPHEPNPVLRVSSLARICICGQAPGTRVHASGKPFTDPSGLRLRDWMAVSEDEFYDRANVAVVPMGFCFPGLSDKGADLPPRRECAETWHQRLFETLPQFDLMLLVGRYAQSWHLGKGAAKTLTETVRNWRNFADVPEGGTSVFPMPHPSWRNNAWIKKNPWFEAELLVQLRGKVRAILD